MVLLSTCFDIATLTAVMAATAFGAAVPQEIEPRDNFFKSGVSILPRGINPSSNNGVKERFAPSKKSGSEEEAPAPRRKEKPEKPSPKQNSAQEGKRKGPTINRGGNSAPKEDPAEQRKSKKNRSEEFENGEDARPSGKQKVNGKFPSPPSRGGRSEGFGNDEDARPSGKQKVNGKFPSPPSRGGRSEGFENDEDARPSGKQKVNGKFPSPPSRGDALEKKKGRQAGGKGSHEAAKDSLVKGGPSDEPGYAESRKQPAPQKPRQQKQGSANKRPEPQPPSDEGSESVPDFQWYKGNGKNPTSYVQETKNAWVQKFRGKYLPEDESE